MDKDDPCMGLGDAFGGAAVYYYITKGIWSRFRYIAYSAVAETQL